MKLYKTTVVIWSEYNPAACVELEDLARDATCGEAYCSKQETILVERPCTDSDWDGTEFFGDVGSVEPGPEGCLTCVGETCEHLDALRRSNSRED